MMINCTVVIHSQDSAVVEDSPAKTSEISNSVTTNEKSEDLNGSEADVDETASTSSNLSEHNSRILEFDSSDNDGEPSENRWLPIAGIAVYMRTSYQLLIRSELSAATSQ